MSKIILFENDGLNSGEDGITRTYTVPISHLTEDGWNDKTSSIVVVSGTWDLYAHVRYGGNRWVVSENGGPEGDGVYRSFRDWDGPDDAISSIKPV